MKMFQFELRKIFFNKRFLFMLLFLIIGISLLFARNYIFQETIIKEREQQIISNIQKGQKVINQYQTILVQKPNDQDTKELLVMMSDMVDTLYETRLAFAAKDWKQELEKENQFLTDVLAFKAAGGEIALLNEEIYRTVAMNKQFLTSNIPPEHGSYSIALPNFMKQVVDILANFGAIIIILIIVGDMLTIEFEQRSINFLYTQPLKKSTIIHSKFWSAFFVYCLVLICSLGTTFGIGALLGNPGTFSYPVLVEQGNEFTFLTIGEYLIFSLTSTTVIALLVIALCLFISLIFKHSIATLLILTTILIGGYLLVGRLTSPSIEWYNPFQYVFTKETLITVGHNWYKGITSTLSFALLCYLLALLRIRTVRT
jgi:ABC-2 type transport system permease protein